MVTMVSTRTKYGMAMLLCSWIWLFVSCQKTTISQTASLNILVDEAQYLSNSGKVAAANLLSTKTQEIEIPWDAVHTLGVKITSSAEPASGKVAQALPLSHKRQTLERDVQYRLLIFDKSDKLLATKDFKCGSNSALDVPFSTKESYSFIVYSFGKKESLPPLNVNAGASMEAVLIALNNFTDAMVCSKMDRKLNEGVNEMDFVLEHTFCKIKTTITSHNVGAINSVGDFEVSKIFQQANIKLNKKGHNGLALQFTGLLPNYTLAPFVIGTNGVQASAAEQLIFVDGGHVQALKLRSLKINNV